MKSELEIKEEWFDGMVRQPKVPGINRTLRLQFKGGWSEGRIGHHIFFRISNLEDWNLLGRKAASAKSVGWFWFFCWEWFWSCFVQIGGIGRHQKQSGMGNIFKWIGKDNRMNELEWKSLEINCRLREGKRRECGPASPLELGPAAAAAINFEIGRRDGKSVIGWRKWENALLFCLFL